MLLLTGSKSGGSLAGSQVARLLLSPSSCCREDVLRRGHVFGNRLRVFWAWDFQTIRHSAATLDLALLRRVPGSQVVATLVLSRPSRQCEPLQVLRLEQVWKKPKARGGKLVSHPHPESAPHMPADMEPWEKSVWGSPGEEIMCRAGL